MSHQSENATRLPIAITQIDTIPDLFNHIRRGESVHLLRLPIEEGQIEGLQAVMEQVAQWLGEQSVLIVVGDVLDLVQVHTGLENDLFYKHWITIQQSAMAVPSRTALPHRHFGALVYTPTLEGLIHTTTRIGYTYCPVCDKTTKDYGGKKHTYHEFGTAISDVWRDIEIDPHGDWTMLYERFADLFGIHPYTSLNVLDMRDTGFIHVPSLRQHYQEAPLTALPSQLIHGDCLESLRQLPSNSVDFIFTDPPYNLKKKYASYADDLEITDYFRWCDEWLSELARVLKPGGTVALLNIPLWTIRHFVHLQTILDYQNWIVWDALAYPVRRIMPAHYSIVCFSKGTPRSLPGLVEPCPEDEHWLRPLAENYCIRAACINDRHRRRISDRAMLTDVWGDLHRLKHNSRRVDHPTQLPPTLMYRLISLFTYAGETVLDCFNGSGTTTLTAHQLGRGYVGIEQAAAYYDLTVQRHREIEMGIDPFRKEERALTAKNSPVARMPKQNYKVPKKTLQMEVKRVAELLGHIPSRDELAEHTRYPVQYYDQYFVGWGEVTAAARTTGMSESRNGHPSPNAEQLRLFEKQESFSD